jgi:pyruvate/2-oxoglutarate dehydrogenase complex dihydrolipoamide acyltransferase (E2) component
VPLSDDQKAMLRLLAQREQGYDEMAALMGLSVEDVRAKVRDALAQLEGEGEPVPPVPPPPIEEPEAVAPAPPTPAPRVEVEPPPPEPETTEQFKRTPKPPAKPPHRAGPPRLPLPADRGARAALIAGAGAAVVLVVLAITGVLGGSGDETTTSAAPSEAAARAEAAAKSGEVPQAILNPVGGGSASGRAIFGRVKNSLALQIEAQGLAPTRQGQSYTVWLAQSPQRMLPLASTRVDKSGRIGAQVAVPTEVLAFLAKGTFDQIVVSLTSDATLKAALTKATNEKKAPIYTGADVLRGTVTGSIVGVAKGE